MTEPVREPKLIAPTRHIHAIWESNNPVVPEGVLCITKDRLYTGSVEYFIGDGTNPYTLLPKFGMNSQEGTASDTVAGMIELATPEEVLAGTDTERGITPATLTAKILGTVSEVDGVPTGAVIERGSNANGEYIKFADGTMICTKTQQITVDSGDWSSTGQIFQITKPVACTWPAVFYTTPVGNVMVRYISTSSGGSRAWASIVLVNTTHITPVLHAPVAGTVEYEVQMSAIGRWY